ncbi:hypothetical protein CEXT_759381 [Caerostris extrusa]|uniref:Uncharacterized protein n=1 Tax=Caerostris extrusa TaxID=172846 RepID=A0AAV4NVL3_CAEEX|nr:hypothetical protein CEXT_759381 [Caerostris extrusa]
MDTVLFVPMVAWVEPVFRKSDTSTSVLRACSVVMFINCLSFSLGSKDKIQLMFYFRYLSTQDRSLFVDTPSQAAKPERLTWISTLFEICARYYCPGHNPTNNRGILFLTNIPLLVYLKKAALDATQDSRDTGPLC